MKKVLGINILWMATLCFAYAQDFRPGFVLKLNGDSISGFVKNGSSKANSRHCYFKTTHQSEQIEYSPEQIKGYGITDDKYFETRNVSKKESEFYFMEVLVKGKVSLFKITGSFYLEKDSLFALSNAPQSTRVVEGRTYNSTTLKYVGVLNYVLSDCNLKADNVPYHEKSMVNLIQNYNRCKGAVGVTYKTKKPWTKVSGIMLTGVDQATVTLDGFTGYSFKQSVSVPVGLGLDLSTPRWSDKSHFSVEIWYDKKLYQGYSESTANGSTNRSDVIINTSYLKIPVGLRLNLLQEENTPYLKAGFVQYFLLNASGAIISEVEKGGVVSTSRSDALIAKKNTNGFWAGGGYSKKIFSRYIGFVEFRFEKNNGFTSSGAGSGSFGNTMNFLIGFKF